MNASRHSPLFRPGIVSLVWGGVCRACVLAEIEQAIADEHPELDRGEV